MDYPFKSLIKYGSSFVFIKYSIVVIGFLRSIFIASTLTVYDMGLLAFIYLIFEYSTAILPLGSINSVNKQISNLKAENKLLNIIDEDTSYIYNSSFIIIFSTILLAAVFIFIFDTYIFSVIPEDIIKSKLLFFLIIALSIYRHFANMHNRLWQRYNRLFISEFIYAIIYLIGIYLFLNSDRSYEIILQVLAISLFISIIASGFIPKFDKLNYISIKSLKTCFSIGFFLMCYITMEQLFWGIDRFFIASILEPEQLAVFHLSHTFGRGVLIFYAAITALFYPLLLTHYSNKIQDINHFSGTMVKMSRFSEAVMILALLSAVIVIPYFVSYFLPHYPDIKTLLFVVLLGLVLKGLAFYPSSYFIAISWQKNLTLISFVFIITIGAIYFLAGKALNLHAFGYTSIAVVVFFLFLCTLTFLLQSKIEGKNKIMYIFKIYYKIFITIFLSIFLLSIPNLFTILGNLNVLILLISLIYFRDFINVINETLIAFLRKDSANLLKSFTRSHQ